MIPQTPVNNHPSEVMSSEAPQSMDRTPFGLESDQKTPLENNPIFQGQEGRNIAAKTPTAMRELLQTVSAMVNTKGLRDSDNNSSGL